ncbi:hypothetical protein NK718_12770 [Alsobacter sp. SYSU M60028]|uniref:Response regulatory domain-containing protein n=1 Tax=Alsobacter ponti TaxID=2962936 RepID=A0ABT1LD15_9HYPH|nr:hypothetical protein [Alsobacter ponti]MCP8939390.1 hypothetical protein [Alsobacter ponti]
MTPGLQRGSVLIVEDEAVIGTLISEIVSDAGYAVLGPFLTAASATAALAVDKPSAALIDIKLVDGTSFSLAGSLRDLGVPFAFVTAYAPGTVPDQFSTVPLIEKPFRASDLEACLLRLISGD